MKSTANTLINDEQTLTGAKTRLGNPIRVYDDGYGSLYIHRDSMGISGIVRARTWEDAYEICEDEFFPSADEGAFVEPTTAHEQNCWDEAYGYRPNGKGGPTPERDQGIYAKDLNGDYLDVLTPELLERLEITLEIENEA